MGKNPCGLPICLCSKNPNMSSLKKLLIPAHIFSLNSFCVAYFSGEISIRIWIGSLPELAVERRIRSSSKAHCNSNNWNVAAAAAAATWWRNYLIKSRRREVIWRESSPYVSSSLVLCDSFSSLKMFVRRMTFEIPAPPSWLLAFPIKCPCAFPPLQPVKLNLISSLI